MLRKMMLVAAVLALILAAAIPAIAQNRNDNDNDNNHHRNNNNNNGGNGGGSEISQNFDQESESGDVNITSDVSSEGDFASQCVAPLQFGNTGNLQNAQGVLQYDSEADDIDLEGSSFDFSPSVETTCDQKVQQSAAASS